MHLKIISFLFFLICVLFFIPQQSESNLLRLVNNAKNMIGTLRHGIRRTACDVLQNGQIYHQPCDQFQAENGYSRPNGQLVKKEIVIEEIDQRSDQSAYYQPQQQQRQSYQFDRNIDGYLSQNKLGLSNSYQKTSPTSAPHKPRHVVFEEDIYPDSKRSNPRPIQNDKQLNTKERGRTNNYDENAPIISEEHEKSEDIKFKPLTEAPEINKKTHLKSNKHNPNIVSKSAEKITEDPCQINDGIIGVCMPASYCYSQHGSIEEYRPNICEFDQDSRFLQYKTGICCPKEEMILDVLDLPIRVPHQINPSVKIRHISLEEINTAAKKAQQIVDDAYEKERRLIQQGMFQKFGTMQMMHQAFFGEFDLDQFQITKGGFINTITTLIIMKTFKLSKEEARDGLYKYSIENTDLEQFCIKEPVCVQNKYRSIDGSCNNHRRPIWGKSNTAFERLVPPLYEDGLHQPRTRTIVDGRTMLPSSRLVSTQCARQNNVPNSKYTLMLMQWGQFLDHDLTLAASTRASTGQGLICCDAQKPIDHHACFPIEIPDDDHFYRKWNQKCMQFVRNSPAPRSDCSLGHREQMNTLTQVIDASMIYGSTPEKAKSLRTFRDGRMKISFINGQPFLPVEKGNQTEDCSIDERELSQYKCFVAGDGRVNEQTGLTMLHNLLLREHNRIAEHLKLINRRWNDEIIYQETRRIVAAEVQHITYNEWLPAILGRRVMKLYGILPKTFGFTKDYNPRVNPNILNEFATAAFRFHTLVQGTIILMDENERETKRLRLSDLFNNPKTLWEPDRFDQYLNGYTTEPAQAMDGYFTEELTNHLFRASGTPFGMDLIALNIQRGRDHGLAGYNTYRRVCGLAPAKAFQDLKFDLIDDIWKTFSNIYKHVDDIDLFIGASHEKPLEDALVGPTFACILGEQFRRTKIGDRFWYENAGLPISFKPEQLAEIRKASIASLICENSDSIQTIQPLAFLRPGGWNKKIDCNKIARVNLNLWKNEKIWS